MTIQVIGAGFGRTGTLSLKQALDALGFNCYHMFEVAAHPEDADKWLEVARIAEEGGEYDFSQIFATPGRPAYQACVDFPAAAYYKRIRAQHPDAKVILTVRDSAEQWYASVKDTIATPPFPPHWSWLLPFLPVPRKLRALVCRVIWDNPEIFDGKFGDRSRTLEVYENWIADVKKVVPPDQLLVYNVKQGWEPLCSFLGVESPAGMPFPRVNDRVAFQAWRKARRAPYVRVVAMAIAAVFGLVCCSVYACVRPLA